MSVTRHDGTGLAELALLALAQLDEVDERAGALGEHAAVDQLGGRCDAVGLQRLDELRVRDVGQLGRHVRDGGLESGQVVHAGGILAAAVELVLTVEVHEDGRREAVTEDARLDRGLAASGVSNASATTYIVTYGPPWYPSRR